MNGQLSSYAGSKFSSDAAASSSSSTSQQQQQPRPEAPQEEERVILPAVLNTQTTGFVGKSRGPVNAWAPAAFSANGGQDNEEEDPRCDFFRDVRTKFNPQWFDVADMVEENNPI